MLTIPKRHTLKGTDVSDVTFAWLSHRIMERDPEVRRWFTDNVTRRDIEVWALDFGAIISEDA